MKQILFPTAYASSAKAAFRYTQKLAQYFEAGITLAHIYDSVSITKKVMAYDEVNGLEDQKWTNEIEQLKTFAQDMAAKQFHSIPMDYIATDGNVVKELLQIQQQNRFDLIVMGMRRHPNNDRLIGKTAAALIDQMNCPLLLIPPNIRYMGLGKIVYGTALEPGDENSIEYLMDWCEAFDASIHILHVAKQEQLQAATDKLELLMQSFLAEREAGIITQQVLSGRIKEVFAEYVEFTGADILALHRRKQGFWQRIIDGSLTKTLAELIPIPILVLKP